MSVANGFFSFPIEVRAAIAILLALAILLILYNPILKLLSLIPFLLKKLFRAIYRLLECTISALHKLFGGGFYSVGNVLAANGKKIDTRLESWYSAWHKPKSAGVYIAVLVVLCLVCYLSVISPSVFHTECDDWKAKGWTVYTHAEAAFSNFAEERGWYDPSLTASVPVDEEEQESLPPIQIPVTVMAEVLFLRDAPSTLDSTSLYSASYGEVLMWNGKLAFGYIEGYLEPWIYVSAESGQEGWCRFYYLLPNENSEFTLMLADDS